MVYAKLYDPCGNWKWYVLEFDGHETVFGLVVTNHLATAGQFTLAELKGIQYRDELLGEVNILRDESFQPQTVAQLSLAEPLVKSLLEEAVPREINQPKDLIQLK